MEEEEIRLDNYIATLWRAKWLILLATLAAAGVAAYLGSRQPTLHTATAQIKIGRVWKEPLEDPYVTAEVTNGAGFLQEVADKIGVKPNQLRRAILADTKEVGPRRARYPILVRVRATAGTSDEAVKLTQAVADEVVARHEKLFDEALAPRLESQRRLEQKIRDLAARPDWEARDLVVKLESELDDVRAHNTSSTLTQKTHLVEPVVPGAVIEPGYRRSVATAALFAALGAIATALAVGHLRPAQKSKTAS